MPPARLWSSATPYIVTISQWRHRVTGKTGSWRDLREILGSLLKFNSRGTSCTNNLQDAAPRPNFFCTRT